MIVVTGMHRSGTSLAALVLQALGLDFGPESDLYAADDWNANGYLERVDAVDLNSRLITGHARTTSRTAQILSQLNYVRMPATTSILERAAEHAGDITDLAHTLDRLAVKDPRFCLTLGAWAPRAHLTGLVVAVRHPSASVASLRRRNRLPASLGHRFWRWHMEAILPFIDQRTLVVSQDRLTGVGYDAEIDRIRRWMLAIAGLEPSSRPIEVIDPSLVHHTPDEAGVPSESLEIWRRLLDVAAFE